MDILFNKQSTFASKFRSAFQVSVDYPIVISIVQSQKWEHQNNVWNQFKVNSRSGVFVVNFEQISHIVLVFLLQSLSK